MVKMQIWQVVHSQRERPEWDDEWTEWNEWPCEFYRKHETALLDIQRKVAYACDKLDGNVIKRDQCADGWEYFEWEENDDGIIKQHIMQIAGGHPGYYVIMD